MVTPSEEFKVPLYTKLGWVVSGPVLGVRTLSVYEEFVEELMKLWGQPVQSPTVSNTSLTRLLSEGTSAPQSCGYLMMLRQSRIEPCWASGCMQPPFPLPPPLRQGIWQIDGNIAKAFIMCIWLKQTGVYFNSCGLMTLIRLKSKSSLWGLHIHGKWILSSFLVFLRAVELVNDVIFLKRSLRNLNEIHASKYSSMLLHLPETLKFQLKIVIFSSTWKFRGEKTKCRQ